MDVVHVLHQSSGLKIEGRHPESRRNPEDEKKHTLDDACRRVEELNDYRGGRRLLGPSTHTRAKYHQPHKSGGQTFIRDAGNQERALVDSPLEVWRRPPDGRRVTRRCWRGTADWTDTGREEAKE